MEENYLIMFKEYTNIVQDIVYKLKSEQKSILFLTNSNFNEEKDCVVIDINDKKSKLPNIKQAIIIDCEYQDLRGIKDIIYISNNVEVTKINKSYRINYIKTDLVLDNNNYTKSQKEFLFKKGKYNTLNLYLSSLMSNSPKYINNTIIDISNIEIENNDYIFEFDSINESYKWITDKSKNQKGETKILTYYLDRLYDDSDKEIKYLIDKIKNIKNGKIITDIFVYKKGEYEKFEKNLLFRNMINQISDTYKVYLIEEEKLEEYYKEHYEDSKYGIIVYEDCVYRDYLDNEISLGYVDCKKETIEKYNNIFEDIKGISELLEKGE